MFSLERNNMVKDLQTEGIRQLVYHCGNVRENERVLVVSNKETKFIGELIVDEAITITANILHHTIDSLRMHGQEPPDPTASAMHTADVIFGMTLMSMAHTEARMRASLNGARYLSLPGYNIDVLSSDALRTDFKKLTTTAEKLGDRLEHGNIINIYSKKGTDLQIDVKNRVANIAPGWCDGPGTLASPPDAEVNIAPNEEKSNGVIVVDGSIPCNEIGLLNNDIILEIKNGSVKNISGDKKEILEGLFENSGSKKSRIIGEFGIGLNPNAELCGMMLPDEGCLGTVHFGIGSNFTIGGNNKVSFHLDHVIKNPSFLIDGLMIMDEGTLII